MKRHLVSALVTFVAGFLWVVVPDIDTITLESIKDGSVGGLLFVGVRAGIKMLAEAFLSSYAAR